MLNIFWLFALLVSIPIIKCGFYEVADVTTEISNEEALRKWMGIGPKAKEIVSNVVDKLWPVIYNTGRKLNFSDQCLGDLEELFLNAKKLNSWAIKMLDSSGPMGGGLFFSSLSSYGDYNGCLEVQSNPQKGGFVGQYCLVDFRPPLPPKFMKYNKPEVFPILKNVTFQDEFINDLKTFGWEFYNRGFRKAVCVPSTCSKEELKLFFGNISREINFQTTVPSCEILEDRKIQTCQIILCFGLSLYLGFVIICSILDAQSKIPKELSGRIIQIFSAQRNWKRAVTIPDSKNCLDALHGVKVLSIMWVILGHTASYIEITMIRGKNYREVQSGFLFQIIGNGYSSVETFICLSAVLIAYTMIKLQNLKIGLNAAVSLFAKRYFRLIPTAFLVVGLTILAPLVGSGPLWNNIVQSQTDACYNTWWSILALYTNFISYKVMCAGQNWYICTDMQLFIIAIVYMMLYQRKPTLAICFNCFLIIASVVALMVQTHYLEHPPTLYHTNKENEVAMIFASTGYWYPHVHIGVYGVGLALGTLLASTDAIKHSKFFLILGWSFFNTIGSLVIFAPHYWTHQKPPTDIESIIYAGLARFAWSLNVAWVAYVCSTGQGGFINTILSWRGFQFLGKLVFLVYLINCTLMTVIVGSWQGIHDITVYSMFGLYIAYLVLSFAFALPLHVLFERPITKLLTVWIQAGNKTKIRKNEFIATGKNEDVELKEKYTTEYVEKAQYIN